ncbi:MAG: phosphatidylserine decarboxylase [Myxococcota bacterium]
MSWRPHRSAAFLRAYRFAPQRLLGRCVAHLARVEHPKPLVASAIRHWVRRGEIDLAQFEPGPFPTVERFFLRRLRPGARPFAAGFASPVDGELVGHGAISGDSFLLVKGHPLSIDRIVNGRLHDLDTTALHGGTWTTIFLTPDGYHHIHMPAAGTLVDVRWLPGRTFPQNAAALRHIPRVYERNERAVLRLRLDSGPEILLVLVGASLIGGIHLEGLEQRRWQKRQPEILSEHRDAGSVLGHFSFGSTVVLLAPPGVVAETFGAAGDPVLMGRPLWGLAGR